MSLLKFRPNPEVRADLLRLCQERLVAATTWLNKLAIQSVNDESSGSQHVKVNHIKGKLSRPEVTIVERLNEKGSDVALTLASSLSNQWTADKATGTIVIKLHCFEGDFGQAELALTQFLGQA